MTATFAGARALQVSELQRSFRQLRRWRDRLLFGTLLLTGCRLSESLSLDLADLYHPDGRVRDLVRFRRSMVKRTVKDGSGSRQGMARDVPVGPDLRELAGRWWPEHPDRQPGSPVFLSQKPKADGDRRMTRRQGGRVLSEAFQRAGVERATSHSLRKYAAIILSRQGVELRVIQSILGHANIKATDAYLRQVQEYEKRAAMERMHVPLLALVPPGVD